MNKVTLKDIATQLNVSVATVSHVLNGIDDISEETKKRVLTKAHDLGYITNNAAVSLRSGRTNTIAIIIPDISNPHISYQVKQIECYMRKLNYSVIILNTNEDDTTEYQAIITACSKQVDGILLCPAQHSTKNIEFLNQMNLPYILIGRYYSELDTDYVCADDFKSGYLAARYLLDQSCRNPIYIGVFNYIQSSKNRFDGICHAFSEAGVPISDERFIRTSPNSFNNKSLDRVLDSDFDSLIVFSDLLAFNVISKLKKENLYSRIPIISFDAIGNHIPLPFYNVSVGMIDDGWASVASAALIDKINGSTKRYKTLIDVCLYIFNNFD